VSLLDAATRWAKERYQLNLMDLATGRIRAVASPLTAYYADPFVVAEDSASWIFFEEFHYPTSRGYIAAARVQSDLSLGAAARVLDLACHASFPFVFRDGGTLHMLPETSNGRCVDLYTCVAMPGQWRHAARLLDGLDCADSVLYRHLGLWYLITSEADARTSPNRWLAIHISDSLVSGRWTPHPVNAQRRYADRPYGYGRNAGALVESGGNLLRPMQASTAYYGQAMRMMRVVELSPSAFEETPFDGEHLYCRIADEWSTHHVSQAGGIAAWDTRTRSGYLRGQRRAAVPTETGSARS
jgi:hypothetical protein